MATLEDGSIDKVNGRVCLGLVAKARAEATEQEGENPAWVEQMFGVWRDSLWSGVKPADGSFRESFGSGWRGSHWGY